MNARPPRSPTSFQGSARRLVRSAADACTLEANTLSIHEAEELLQGPPSKLPQVMRKAPLTPPPPPVRSPATRTPTLRPSLHDLPPLPPVSGVISACPDAWPDAGHAASSSPPPAATAERFPIHILMGLFGIGILSALAVADFLLLRDHFRASEGAGPVLSTHLEEHREPAPARSRAHREGVHRDAPRGLGRQHYP